MRLPIRVQSAIQMSLSGKTRAKQEKQCAITACWLGLYIIVIAGASRFYAMRARGYSRVTSRGYK